MTKSEIATIENVKTCPHERYTEVSIWPLWCDRCHVFKQFIKGYRAGRADREVGNDRGIPADIVDAATRLIKHINQQFGDFEKSPTAKLARDLEVIISSYAAETK